MSELARTSDTELQQMIDQVKAIKNGTVKRIHVCTRCLRSGKVTKAPQRAVIKGTA